LIEGRRREEDGQKVQAMIDPGDRAPHVRLRSRVQPEASDVDLSLELFNSEASLFRIDAAPAIMPEPDPPQSTPEGRCSDPRHGWRIGIGISARDSQKTVWQFSVPLPQLNVSAERVAAMAEQFVHTSRPRLHAGTAHVFSLVRKFSRASLSRLNVSADRVAAIVEQFMRSSRPWLQASTARAFSLMRKRSRVQLTRLSTSERRTAALVVITGIVIAATAGQLSVRAGKSGAPVDATVEHLPSAVPFAAASKPVTPQVRRDASPATVATTVAPRSGDAGERRAVQETLNGYRDAVSTLDAGAVAVVWPSANVDALRRQFAGIKDQNLEFEQCRISIADVRADASCSGVIERGLVPRARRPHTLRTQWRFTLERAGHRWLIRSVDTGAN
jgi:hypothetical protein